MTAIWGVASIALNIEYASSNTGQQACHTLIPNSPSSSCRQITLDPGYVTSFVISCLIATFSASTNTRTLFHSCITSSQRLKMSSSRQEDEPLLSASTSSTKVVTFGQNDPDDPRNWPHLRKWLMVAVIIPIDLSVSWGASGFSPAAGDFAKDVGVSPHVATLGLSLYVLGLAFGPMTLAPLSEYFGRRPVYIVSYGIFLLLLLATTYVETLAPFLVLRLFSGYFASTTISNFGGTIADLFHHHDTGPAMSWFLWAATGGSPTGFVLFSFIKQGRGWHEVFRIMFFICLSFWVVLVVALYALGETRHSVILLKRAEAIRRATGDERLEVPDEMKQRGPKQLFGTALARPFRFLAGEAIVQFGAAYNCFLYGLSFLFNGAFHMIFGPNGYGFDTSGVGISFLGIVIGITLGLVTNIYQERYYQRRVIQAGGRDVPEARVHHAKLAAVVLPLSLLAFAFLATPDVHPFFPVLASAFWGWSFYTLSKFNSIVRIISLLTSQSSHDFDIY
jgi:MFS family permease